jgi:hypothetical protein
VAIALSVSDKTDGWLEVAVLLIDYLRFVAFAGRLRGFFSDSVARYVDPAITTGQHLRYAPDYRRRMLDSLPDGVVGYPYWGPLWREVFLERVMRNLGIARDEDGLSSVKYRLGKPPATFAYKEFEPPELEIIIDIDPPAWTPRFNDAASYEGTPILYRAAGRAAGHVGSGNKLFSRQAGQSHFGTLCGLFRARDGKRFALTCGHVASANSEIILDRTQRVLGIPVWRHHELLGTTSFYEVCGPPQRAGAVEARLDAALITINGSTRSYSLRDTTRCAHPKPITSMLQEEPVQFLGAATAFDAAARVSAVTVRKSIDLLRDGQLREIGDVLMLGHRSPMYIARRVSRPGDSGAAVRQDSSSVRPSSQPSEWYGMLIGGDDTGAFVSYAEHLHGWATEVTGDSNLEFAFEL